MLKRLFISNYAIIEKVQISFDKGLNILTGETGAGKSIVIGAVSLILGEQSSTEIIRKGADRCSIEGTFLISSLPAPKKFLKDHDLPEDDELTLRREVYAEGKSRAFINDTPVPVYLLKQMGDLLIDLHGQHQHQSLLNPERYYEIVDSYGGLNALAEQAAQLFRKVRELETQREQLLQKSQLLREKRDLLEFQLREIVQVDPQQGEDVSIENELRVLENREKIWELSQQSYQMLYEDEGSIVGRLQEVIKLLQSLAAFDTGIQGSIKNLEDAKASVQESASSVLKYTDPEAFNPEHLEELRGRIFTLMRLKRKYGSTIDEVLLKKEKIEADLAMTESVDKEIVKTDAEKNAALNELAKLCLKLSKGRSEAAARMSGEVVGALVQLGMKDARFVAGIIPQKDPNGKIRDNNASFAVNEHGIDRIEFSIATNKGEDLKPLAKIASGGEISRVMLAIKCVLAREDRIPVLIFDEIDSGISGRVASVVGKKLRDLGSVHQLICITHLPQIAGMGEYHFTAEKVFHKDRVQTKVRKLSFEERKVEIAKLLGGEKITETNIKNAEELLKAGEHG